MRQCSALFQAVQNTAFPPHALLSKLSGAAARAGAAALPVDFSPQDFDTLQQRCLWVKGNAERHQLGTAVLAKEPVRDCINLLERFSGQLLMKGERLGTTKCGAGLLQLTLVCTH